MRIGSVRGFGWTAVSILVLCVACSPCQESAGFPVLRGPYLGQAPPGPEPELFAPGIVSTGLAELNSVFTPDGGEFYYAVDTGLGWVILMSRQEEGIWSEPRVTTFTRDHAGVDLCISSDGQRLFYCSNRSRAGSAEPEQDFDIWVVERTGEGSWSAPVNLEAVNSEASEFYPCITADGTLYFLSRREGGIGGSDLYRSRPSNGKYTEPENLGPVLNTPGNEGDVFVAPDESYVIFNSRGRETVPGDGSLYISFRGEDDTWSEPRNLGSVMKADRSDFCPMLSPDGKYFFFSSARTRLGNMEGEVTWKSLRDAQARPENGGTDIYWVDAGFVEKLRP